MCLRFNVPPGLKICRGSLFPLTLGIVFLSSLKNLTSTTIYYLRARSLNILLMDTGFYPMQRAKPVWAACFDQFLSDQTGPCSAFKAALRISRGRGGGTPLLFKLYRYGPPIGQGFAPFWAENGYTLCPFWSGIGYGF